MPSLKKLFKIHFDIYSPSCHSNLYFCLCWTLKECFKSKILTIQDYKSHWVPKQHLTWIWVNIWKHFWKYFLLHPTAWGWVYWGEYFPRVREHKGLRDVKIVIGGCMWRLFADIHLHPIFDKYAWSLKATKAPTVHVLDKQQLCEEVRHYKHLYNPSLKQYKDRQMCNNMDVQ